MKRQSILNNQSVRKRGKGSVFLFFNAIHRLGSCLLKVSLLFVVIGVISISFLSLYHYLLKSPYIRLEEVDVRGVDGEIKNDLIKMCGLDDKRSLLALHLNELKQKMEKHPWIRSVKLERRFPHILIVQAEKEIPLALVLRDKVYYMNRRGEAFKEVDKSEEMDFPVITGLSKEEADVKKQLGLAVFIIKILESEEGLWSLNELSEINVKKDGGLSLYFNHLPVEIKLMSDLPAIAGSAYEGKWAEDFSNRLDGLKKVADHLRQTGRIHQVTKIDLNYVDGAVVTFGKV